MYVSTCFIFVSADVASGKQCNETLHCEWPYRSKGAINTTFDEICLFLDKSVSSWKIGAIIVLGRGEQVIQGGCGQHRRRNCLGEIAAVGLISERERD